jgi:DNA polymerase (family 10)
VEVAGSLRRRCELIRDVDLVVALDGPPEGLVGRLRTAPGVREFAHPSARAVTFRFGGGTMADLYLAPPAQFGLHLLRATGTSAHLDALAVRVAERGLRWTADALCRDDDPLPTPTEEAVYAALDLPWIPPELRESGEEVAAASGGALPDLVSRSDLRGFLHCHSSYSDGMNSVAEWAAAAHAAGYTYLGITDHSPATAFAGGIQLREIERQHAEIDAVNRAAPGVRLFKGVEADILETGALDYTPRVRRTFDFIIASVHTRFGMDAEQMTARVLTAMDDPTMTILGHPTGRLLLSRDPYPLDLDRVFARAAERGIAIEINADPQRLDLDWRVLRQAAAAGVTISIGADAHGVAHMHHADLGVGIARKGWLSKDQILNVRPAEEFLAFARRRRR